MRRTKRSGGFLICLLLNMLLNIEWSIPAWILLILHFTAGLSLWWFFLALGVWILAILLWMRFIGWASDCSRPDPPKENKNPYSAKSPGEK